MGVLALGWVGPADRPLPNVVLGNKPFQNTQRAVSTKLRHPPTQYSYCLFSLLLLLLVLALALALTLLQAFIAQRCRPSRPARVAGVVRNTTRARP